MDCPVLCLRRSPRSNRPMLQVEQMEARWCPSGSPVLQYTVKNSVDSSSVLVAGHITNGAGGQATVVFSGAFAQSIQTDSNGYFTFTAAPAGQGVVAGTAFDKTGAQSNTQKAIVANKPPIFESFTITEDLNNIWVFEGTIADANPTSVTITFQGLACLNGVTAPVDSDGDFSVGVVIPVGSSGTILAIATDAWGQTATASTTI